MGYEEEKPHAPDAQLAPSAHEAELGGPGNVKPTTTLREDVAAVGLDKVYDRHGRVDLVPMVSFRRRGRKGGHLPKKKERAADLEDCSLTSFLHRDSQPSDDPHGERFSPETRQDLDRGLVFPSAR